MILLLITMMTTMQNNKPLNVLGTELQSCCMGPMTGWYRDGYCKTDARDRGVHVVCAVMTEDFLTYTSSCGNDLSSPAPQYGFHGLKAGDQWCLCVSRWKEAMDAGVAPSVVLESTHAKALAVVTLEQLQAHQFQD